MTKRIRINGKLYEAVGNDILSDTNEWIHKITSMMMDLDDIIDDIVNDYSKQLGKGLSNKVSDYLEKAKIALGDSTVTLNDFRRKSKNR